MTSLYDDGCTLTGALSVTTEIARCITLIHGPSGCAHHNFSLLHALHAAQGRMVPPLLISTDMTEKEVIFGGERLLEETIRSVVKRRPDLVCVLSTCVTATIGDDVDAVCHGSYQTPVVHIPTGGFIGGGFLDGHIQALVSLSLPAKESEKTPSVNLIGEKTLEYEVNEHYQEIKRLLSLVGVPVNVRFVSGTTFHDLAHLGRASLNILRDPSMVPVGEHLKREFGTPFIESFPLGMEGTLRFLERVGSHFSIDVTGAVTGEEAIQKAMVQDFSSLKGKRIIFDASPMTDVHSCYGYELAEMLELEIHEQGDPVPLPDPFPVGTSGIRRLLQRWRRRCHA
ncbi:MAG: nitrogenase component 1 [Methanolinea sp.]|jgi:nitrogenase molybdenum-iron protein alpha/beta subunit|nr:nitrogenase component 1 [Methanolinea sp.]